MHFSLLDLAQDNVNMPPVAVHVVLAVHGSLCRNFHPCIFVPLIHVLQFQSPRYGIEGRRQTSNCASSLSLSYNVYNAPITNWRKNI